MFFNLKLRTLFGAILAILAALVLTTSVMNWHGATEVYRNFKNVNSIAVHQADYLRMAQIAALRAVSRNDGASNFTDSQAREKEVASARGYLDEANRQFAMFEK